MATKAAKVSVNTILKIGAVETPIGLMKATGDSPKSRKWEVRKPPTPEAEEKPAEEKASPLGASSAPESTPSEAASGGAVSAPKAPEKPRKGILKDDGAFVDLTDEIEAIGERSKLEFMQIVSFIDRGHVPRERIQASYYVAGGSGDEGLLPPAPVLKVLADAMGSTGRVAVCRFSKKKGQTLGILTPRRDGALLLLELCFAEQWREPGPKALIHTHVEVPEERATDAADLIIAMAGRRDSIDNIHDLRVQMESELAAKAEAGEMDEFELPPVGQGTDEETEQLGRLLQEAAAAAA